MAQSQWRRAVGFGLLIIAAIFAIVSMTSVMWVTDRNITAKNTEINLGLNHWEYETTSHTSKKYTYDDNYYYSNDFGTGGLGAFMGDADDWKQAGLAVLALGSIAVIITVLTAFSVLSTLAKVSEGSNWFRTALPSWVAGFCFILGAILYEGIRPSFNGDIGYNWPMGLFITSGVFVDTAAILFYWETVSNSKLA